MNTMQCKFIRLIREPGENFRQACTCSTYVLAVTVYNAVDGSSLKLSSAWGGGGGV